MTGRPRTRRAETLALYMACQLRDHGPQHVADMLNRYGCGPADWGRMPRWERAASRMAVGVLMREWGARLDVDGRLYLPPRRRSYIRDGRVAARERKQ